MDLKWKIGFILTAIASIIFFIISLYDIILLQERFRYWLFSSFFLFMITLLLFFYIFLISTKQLDPVVLFEKTLHGGLYHFKCSYCHGIFALKESKKNDLRNLTLTCPDCGAVGRISSHPPKIIDSIPTEKSQRMCFICTRCGEQLNLWSEGKPLFENINIFSCPYCGINKPMKPE